MARACVINPPGANLAGMLAHGPRLVLARSGLSEL